MPRKKGYRESQLCKVCKQLRDNKPGVFCTFCRRDYDTIYHSFIRSGKKFGTLQKPQKVFAIIFPDEGD